MGILGSTQHQIVVLEKIDQAGIAFHHARNKLNHAVKNLVQLAGNHASSDLVQKIDLGSFKKHRWNLPVRNEHQLRRNPGFDLMLEAPWRLRDRGRTGREAVATGAPPSRTQR
jgi:hypothetical protein